MTARIGYRAVHEEVVARRLRRGMTQEEMARKAKMDPSYTSFVERGLRVMGPNVARRLCKALGLTVEEAVDERLLVIETGEGDGERNDDNSVISATGARRAKRGGRARST